MTSSSAGTTTNTPNSVGLRTKEQMRHTTHNTHTPEHNKNNQSDLSFARRLVDRCAADAQPLALHLAGNSPHCTRATQRWLKVIHSNTRFWETRSPPALQTLHNLCSMSKVVVEDVPEEQAPATKLSSAGAILELASSSSTSAATSATSATAAVKPDVSRWQCLWCSYIDANKTQRQGRKLRTRMLLLLLCISVPIVCRRMCFVASSCSLQCSELLICRRFVSFVARARRLVVTPLIAGALIARNQQKSSLSRGRCCKRCSRR